MPRRGRAGRCYWKPVRQQPRPEAPLAGLGAVLSTTPSRRASTPFAGASSATPLRCQAGQGALSLTLPWSGEEWQQLLGASWAIAFQQQRFKLEPAPFIAVLEGDEDGVISLRLQDAAVVLEWPGRRERRVLADTLEAFIGKLLDAPQPSALRLTESPFMTPVDLPPPSPWI